jgi:hypothetical protein
MKAAIRHRQPVTGENLWHKRLLSGIVVAAQGFVGILGFTFPQGVFAGEADPHPTIIVQVYNYSQASPAALTGAEREAGRILGEAGLRAVWLDCPVGPSPVTPKGPCWKELEPTDVRLRVLSAPTQNEFQETVFGFTVHPVFASVYYESAWRRAKNDGAEFEISKILGGVMAHELGHLLLGTNSHSSTGIMQPRWEPNQVRQLMMGTLLFTPGQSKLMREQARMRTRLQMGKTWNQVSSAE